ncbi:MAG: MFS transporter [Bauldia sp.]|nr:MFS transporter [Bauldia sp.]
MSDPNERFHGLTIGTIGAAHFGSHFLQLSLAPILPLIRDDFGVSFLQLSWVLTVFYATSGIGQIVAGILVDRFGPHRLLMVGITLQSLAVLAMAIVPDYHWLFPLAFIAGLGNSVYHPADLSILSRRIPQHRLGRALATHVIGGSIGFAAAPLVIGGLGAAFGWRVGLASAGVVGLLIAAFVIAQRHALHAPHIEHHDEGHPHRKLSPSFLAILSLPVIRLTFLFFALSSLNGAAIMNFGATALTEGYEATLALANVGIAIALGASIVGTFASGIIIDRGTPHRVVAVVALVAGGAACLLAGAAAWPILLVIALLAIAEFFFGATLPPRDITVREAVPAGSLGKSFGIVYSGLDAGQLVGPVIYGFLLDHSLPQFVFVVAGLAMLAMVPTLTGAWRKQPAAAKTLGGGAS